MVMSPRTLTQMKYAMPHSSIRTHNAISVRPPTNELSAMPRSRFSLAAELIAFGHGR
jgi:hypothetical protein